jgi:dipeptidyl aminopeptidase/acylaminoacyl peptidase
MNADGSDITRLTENGPDDSDITPDWSPDGTRIVFAGSREAERDPTMGVDDLDIYVIRADGTGGEDNLSDPEEIEFNELFPDWSPDGSLIAYQGVEVIPYEIEGEPHEGGFRKIMTMEPDGSNRTVISELQDPGDDENPDRIPNHDEAPSWSPDGEWIAFFTDQQPEQDYDVQLVRRDGTGQVNVTPDYFASDSFPTWSPDGTEIIFSSNRGVQSGTDLFVMNVTSFTGGPASDLALRTMDGATAPEIRRLTRGQRATQPDWQGEACTITGTAEGETLMGTPERDVICGRGGDDVLEGLGGDDVLIGGRGNDVMVGGPGRDELGGGIGSDTASYATDGRPVTVVLGDDRATGQGVDHLASVENVRGSPGDDVLVGSAVSNRLRGAAGGDDLSGLRGDDVLDGGAGTDDLDGGVGSDRCIDADADSSRRNCES